MSSTVFRAASSASKSKYLLSVAAAVMLSACSESMDRFSSNPSDADPVYTASMPRETAEAPPAASDEGIATRPLNNAALKAPSYDYSKSYKAPAYKQPEAGSPQVANVEEPAVPAGGTVVVSPGMTLYSIARANNLSVAQLAAANNIKAPYSVQNGQTIRVPGAAAPVMPEAATAQSLAKPSKPAHAPANAKAGAHTVASGETLFSLGRKYGVSPYEIAKANGLSNSSQLSLGQQVRIPAGGKAAAPALAAKPAAPKLEQQASATTPDVPAEDEAETVPGKTADAAAPKIETAAPAVPEQAAAETAAPVESDTAGMRWPVRGKIISAFGPKTNGLKNEGINIAVPEGTSVRAAGGGVVAYAGNELKGYGNLVLIRHDDGYVTAYAHAKELFVKRGDTVKRGDVIAKAGQTGSVSSPQLHFEVRKGATALDPMKFLSSATASN